MWEKERGRETAKMNAEKKQWQSKENCKCVKYVVSCICAAENFNKSWEQSIPIIACTVHGWKHNTLYYAFVFAL